MKLRRILYTSVLGLTLSYTHATYANNPISVVRTISEIASITRASVEVEAAASQIFSLAVKNSLTGMRLTSSEISALKEVGNISEEGALVEALGEARAKEFIESVKATVYSQNTLLLNKVQSEQLEKMLADSKSLSAEMKSEAGISMTSSVSKATSSRRTGFSLKVNQFVAAQIKSLPKPQVERLYGHLQAMGQHAVKYPNLRSDLTAVAQARVEIANVQNVAIGKPVPYSSTTTTSGVCDVTAAASMKNLRLVDELYLTKLKTKGSLTLEEAQGVYDVAFAETLTNGDLIKGEELQTKIQCGGCPDKSAAITGVLCSL